MDRVSIYEYDRKNRERVVKAIEEAGGQILSWSFFAKDQQSLNSLLVLSPSLLTCPLYFTMKIVQMLLSLQQNS